MANTSSTFHTVLSRLLPGPLKALAIRFDRSPIDTPDRLADFLMTRSAYVAQTSLYGYLKTRMGTQYAKLFQDATFAEAINLAKWPIIASCLSDLTVFASAVVARDARLSDAATRELAADLFRRAIDKGFDAAAQAVARREAVEAFAARIALTDWSAAADDDTAFGRSPRDLVRHAPVSDEYRQLDGAIVSNSMRFRWLDVRRQFTDRLAASEMLAAWMRERSSTPASTTPGVVANR